MRRARRLLRDAGFPGLLDLGVLPLDDRLRAQFQEVAAQLHLSLLVVDGVGDLVVHLLGRLHLVGCAGVELDYLISALAAKHVADVADLHRINQRLEGGSELADVERPDQPAIGARRRIGQLRRHLLESLAGTARARAASPWPSPAHRQPVEALAVRRHRTRSRATSPCPAG